MWSAVQREKKIYGLDVVVGLSETIDRLAMTSNVCCYDHVLRMEYSRVLRRVLHFEVECQMKNGKPKRTWKKQVEEECAKVGLSREDALCKLEWIVCVNLIVIRYEANLYTLTC